MAEPTLFERILSTNILNFIIVLSTLVLIFKKARLGDLIQRMADNIKISIEESKNSIKNASEEFKAAKKEADDLPIIEDEIYRTSQANVKSLKSKIEEQTIKQENEIKQNLEKINHKQGKRAKKVTIKEIYLACVDMAQKEILARLDEKMHRKLIKTSINEIEKVEGNLS